MSTRGVENRQRTCLVGVRLLPSEYDLLVAVAAECGISLGEALRQAFFARHKPAVSP